MSFKQIHAGHNIPHDINIVVEIPANSYPVKYEVDKNSGAILVDRILGTSMHYPCNYGYMPQTLAEDGDPLDALVIAPFPLLAGSVVRCRPVGVLNMEDESGPDAKLLVVPIDKVSPLYSHIQKPDDLPAQTLASIKHFFEHYKDLEPNKWVKVKDWSNGDSASKCILDSINRYKREHEKT